MMPIARRVWYAQGAASEVFITAWYIWSFDSMYAPPADLHHARLVAFLGAMLGSVLDADAKSA